MTPGPIPVLVVPGTAALSEALWQQIAPLLLAATTRRGRPSGDLRRQLNGMLAVMHSGWPWRAVPSTCGPWQTVYARYALWVRTGLWEQIAAILHPDPSAPLPVAPP
jgi:transposase